MLFVALILVGVAYIAAFVWFKRNSVDFIERDKDRSAALAAGAIRPSTFAWTFERGSHALSILGGGWQRPDPVAIWSARHGGVVYLPASVSGGSEIEVRFDGRLNPPDQEMTVILDASGEVIGEWRLTHQHWQIVDRVVLPSHPSGTSTWRLQFAIQRPGRLLWRGYEPGLLAYGIHLRGLRTVGRAVSDQPIFK
ncbi:MAG: hypothetical protein WAV67_00330 [Dokdonella sp.]